jgi:hypothetical protein
VVIVLSSNETNYNNNTKEELIELLNQQNKLIKILKEDKERLQYELMYR